MSAAPRYDKLIKNVRVVRPHRTAVDLLDLAIKDGRFAHIAPEIAPGEAKEVVDGKRLLAFPGVVDAHTHAGIYSPLEQDAVTESRAAAQGGVTTMLTYFRTGQYYLNRGGPYAEFYPEVLRLSEGRYHVDYAYHLAPIHGRHIDEIESLAKLHGVTSFKIFMFYGSHGLHGRSTQQRDFLMLEDGERYDFAHFEFIMRGLTRAMENNPALAEYLSLSLHCELAEIMTAYTERVEREGKLKGLAAYSAARPPHSEGLAVWVASYLANETNCVNINLLHLSSRKALEAALTMQRVFPHINFRREVTIGHLLLDIDTPTQVQAKVNPPIRPREDVEYLWEQVLARNVDWVVSDHACCSSELKWDAAHPDDIWMAKAGFGGTEYLLPGLVSEGSKRGMSYNHMAELTSANPARRYGLLGKGDIAVGYDADLALVDPDANFTVRAAESESGQGYTPFEGQELHARVRQTYVRGTLVCEDGNVVGKPTGQYLRRPYGLKR
ncbi:MAG TPA: dihydroorotase family protein [bacterium]|nr:dihydroorotase family protein [bacterium]